MQPPSDPDYLHSWQPVTAIVRKDEAESARMARRIDAARKQCWRNAIRVILELDEYANESYVEGIVALAEVGILIEHGWVCRRDGTVIDPTLPTGVDAYFPGLEFPGRHALAAYLTSPQVQACGLGPPLHYAFGFAGSRSPSYIAAWQQAWSYHQALTEGYVRRTEMDQQPTGAE